MTNAIFWAEAATDPLARAARPSSRQRARPPSPSCCDAGVCSPPVSARSDRCASIYRHSPLSSTGTRPPKNLPRAGDRLPDVPVTTSTGPTRLHELTAHPGIDLFLQHDSPQVPAVPGSVHVHRLVDFQGTGVIAVRPDGYVGFSGDSADLHQLTSWLELVHAPPCRPTT